MASIRRIRRIRATETAFSLWKLETFGRLGGNPLGIAWRQLDRGADAVLARRQPGPTYSRVMGLRGDLIAEIEPLLAWYAEAGIKPRLETISTYHDPALAAEQVRRGYFQSGFQVVLVAPAIVSADDAAAGAVEEVASAEQLAAFLQVYGWPALAASEAPLEAAVTAGTRGVSLYLGRGGGRPAAAGLFVKDGIGVRSPALGAAIKAGSGLEAGLLARRLAAARAAGAEWVCTEADLMSPRQISLTRIGFTAAFIRAQWTSL